MSAIHDFSISECGGLAMNVNGEAVLMRCSGAAWLAASRTLIVADLHFEKGSAYAARGQMLPPYDTRETLERLEAEVAATQPAVLVFLGDSFHDGKGEGRLAVDVHGQPAALADREVVDGAHRSASAISSSATSERIISLASPLIRSLPISSMIGTENGVT